MPLIGARTRERLAEALGALDAAIDDGGPGRDRAGHPPDAAAGERYPTPQMAMLDSERT